MINGTTELMGLIGNPVTHTLSPFIQNTLAKQLGIDMVYVPLPVTDGLQDAVKGAFRLGIWGMNVTVPYKTKVMPYLQEIDEKAALIGAVNTLVPYEQGYKGYNTDYLGLYQALLSEGIDLCSQKVVIIGAGGAARAAAFLCAWKCAVSVVIANRTVEKAEEIVRDVRAGTGYKSISAISLYEIGGIPGDGYLALQTTNVGLGGAADESPVTDEDFFKKLYAAYDVIYNPAETAFMKMARKQGIPAYNGFKMLLYQGIESFQLWNRMQVPERVTENIYQQLKGFV